MASPLVIPEDVSFEGAIALTQSLMEQMEQEQLSDVDLTQTLTQLVATENGARGFFVTYLTSDRPLADQPSTAVLSALNTAPESVGELLVKNLAMSSAMAVTHRRNGNHDMAEGSDRVRSRTAKLIQQLQLSTVPTKLTQLKDSATTGTGDYASFLTRWGYDDEQRQVIVQAIDQSISAG